MMKTSVEQFDRLLNGIEDADLELKEAKNHFPNDRGSLFDYCAAIANGNGGKLILGVQEKPRTVVGTTFMQGTHNQLSHEIWERLRINVDVEEFDYHGKRVLIFHIPKHPSGFRVKSGGKGNKYLYPVRRSGSLGEMDDIKTKEILNENQPDFTASVVQGLSMGDLDKPAVDVFRKKWAEKSGRKDYLSFDDEKVLRNTGLIDVKGGMTFAGLILVGQTDALRKHLADAEIIFEWRNDPKQTHYDFRKNWREPFCSIDDEIWNTINARNIRIPFQEGFFQREIWAFDEKSIREAVHNAIMHRDYSIKGRSIFIKASPQEFLIESPGGFPHGITADNALFSTEWRNRLLAEAFGKIGFAERSGQGFDDIFEKSIRDGKGLPDLSRSDFRAVRLAIPAQVKDKDFILYLERVVNERQVSLSFEEIYELEKVREGQKIANTDFKNKFLQMDIIEQVGRTRGAKYILSHKYYVHKGKSGVYTRLRGVSREYKKELILLHLSKNGKGFARDFKDVSDDLSLVDVSNLLRELKQDGKIVHEGSRRTGYWRLK